MRSLFASVLSFLGMGAATMGSSECLILWAEEETTPKSLIK